jgi:hypothetical protein
MGRRTRQNPSASSPRDSAITGPFACRETATSPGSIASPKARIKAARRPSVSRKNTGARASDAPANAGSSLARKFVLPNRANSAPVSAQYPEAA